MQRLGVIALFDLIFHSCNVVGFANDALGGGVTAATDVGRLVEKLGDVGTGGLHNGRRT